jgi:asparagine synthase (glutamine-hydrolysing)
MCGLILAPARYPDWSLKNALARMAYRGDGERGHCEVDRQAGWKLGHTRLAIQDLSDSANQPFVTGRGNLVAFVGELFNSKDQSELVYLSWLLEDPYRFHEVDGFWAVAEVTLDGTARVYTDHLGVKPVYYWPEYGIVCSEIEPMFALEPRPGFDRTYLSNCIKFGYDYSGRTPYEGIFQLAPGSVLENTGLGPSIKPYWSWSHVPLPYSLREAVDDAILNRLKGEREVAMLLSGGLDSSIIYYTLEKLGLPIKAFSVENGESEYLPEGVKLLDLPPITPEEAVRVLKAPLDLGSMVPQVQLARAVAKEGFKVCLTGDGADEVFGGYSRAAVYDSQHSDVFCELPYYHLPRLDRVMMASTIELRSPYLSPQVVAFGLTLPRKLRTEKQALKLAYKSLLPKEIVERKKHPLKTEDVVTGGLEYRQRIVQAFVSNATRSE